MGVNGLFNDGNYEIVIVDDAVEYLKLLSDILTKEGYSVHSFDSGELALRSIKENRPSLVLLDLLMPVMDGFDVCRQLKADEYTCGIPVIFISGSDDKESMLTGFQIGGVDFINKPFIKEEVLARVKTHISLFYFQLDLIARNEILQDEIIKRKQVELAIEKRMMALTQPIENSMAVDFDDLFNIAELQKLQDQFASAFGVASIITQPDGTPITSPSNFSRLCQNIIRCTEKGLLNCMYSDSVIGRHNPEGPVVQTCLSGGLWDTGASISVGGKHIANWLVGQVRNEVQQEGKMAAYAREIGADEADFMQAFNEITSMSQEQFQKISEVLFTMAGQLSAMAYQNIQQARFINERKVAETALVESEERFRTTLYSIGDGVITTDPAGKVSMMNPVAEQLTGWSQADAAGKMLEEVFPIINEGTRAQVEIPVRKVLREGVIVGLANHTLLIAKDGTERPIADSGSPIQNENGETIGVVLVFQDQTEERKSEKKLLESEFFFRESQRAAYLGSYKFDLVTGFWDSSDVLDHIFGIDKEHVRNVDGWKDLILADDLEMMDKHLNEDVLGERKPFNKEYRIVRKSDGEIRWVNGLGKLILDTNGNIVSLIGTIQDITKRKRTENVLKESEEKFRSLFEDAAVGISITNMDGSMQINNSFCEMLGYTKTEFQEKKWQEITHPDDMQKSGTVVNSLLQRETDHIRFEKRYLHKNGAVVWADVSTTIERDENNNPVYFITSISDITERRKVEKALRKADEKMDAFFNQSLDGFFFMKLDQPINWNDEADKEQLLEYAFLHMKIVRVNDAMLAQYGAVRDRFLGLTLLDFFAHDIQQGKNLFQKLFSRGKLHTETEERKLNGEPMFIDGDYTCLYDSRGWINGLFGIQRDITDVKKNLEAIQNERQLLRTLIDHLPDPIYVKDNEGRKMLANLADLENIGVSKESEVLGRSDLELFNSEIGFRSYEDDLTVIEKGEPVINREEIFFDKNGVKRWLLTTKIPIIDKSGKTTGLVGIGRDITEQKKAHETIQKLSKGIEQSPSTIVISDVLGNIEYVNPKFREITGYTTEEVIGQNPRILQSGETPPEKYKELWNKISSGEVWRGEFRNRKKNGELFWEWVTMTSIKNNQGEITNYIAIKEDISSRKQMEVDLIIAKEKAEENDRLKSAFLANMSHEIRTPLNSIIGFAELLSDPDFELDERYEFASLIGASGNNLLAIITDIMDISKIEAGQVVVNKSVFNAHKLIHDVHNEYKFRAHDKGIELMIASATPDEDCSIYSDQIKIKQVLINFVGNALKFTENGCILIGLKVNNQSVEFFVKDTGLGIPVAHREEIFERFRQVEDSSTRKYGGNGLGLAISKSLIEMLDGTIGMESEPGKGSTFYFTLPTAVLEV